MTRASSCRSRVPSPPGSPGAALLLAGLVVLGAWPTPGDALPPIRYNGEVRLNGRTTGTDQGGASYLFGRTGRVNMESFVWRPWFASIGGGLDLSWVDTWAESHNATTLLGGDVHVTLFPASRFPTFGFVSVTDTRTDVDVVAVPDREVRRTRFGLRQTYQALTGGTRFAGRISRTIEEGTDDRQEAIIDQGALSGSFLTERQRFSGDLTFRRLERDLNDEELFELIGTVRHNARPADTVTVDSFATYTDTSSESTLVNFKNRTLQGNSLALWRPHRIPLTVSGTARVTAARRERDGSGDDNTSGNLALGADYLLNRLTRVSGNVTANFSDGRGSSNQGATVSYNPDSLGLGSFAYNWFTSSTLSNEVGNPAGDRTVLGALFGHGVTRARPFASAPTWSLSLAANNTLSGSMDSLNGGAATVGLNGSAGVSHAARNGFTNARIDATATYSDGASRQFASGDNNFQSVTFNFDHRTEISNHSQWSAVVATGWNRQDFGGAATTTEFSTLGIGYTDSRVFGVPRMLFRSQLNARTIQLFFSDLTGEETTDIRWENRLEYFIGKLETRLTATWSRVGARDGYSVLLTVARKFDGVM
jgi:hypothetical protein